MRVIIDGSPVDAHDASISVFDWAVFRGLGAFEVFRSRDGRLLHLDPHLDRLERSSAMLGLPPLQRAAVAEWAGSVASANEDGLVRVVVTAGGRDDASDPVAAAPRVIVVWEPLPALPERLTLLPMRSPWHPATDEAGFPGVKWLSYGPNMASTDAAHAAGFDDALLTTMDDIVLELPTASVAWVSQERLVTPSLDLGILPSITREVMLECAGRLGIAVLEGRFHLGELLAADEVLALSTGKMILPVGRVGDTDIPSGPVTGKLAAAYDALAAEEAG
jgi:branched-subunit amino acid aminotransferase/4-amino-4-deoxychorismate lyase